MSKKILICDDEEGVRESLKLILSDHFDLIVTDSPQQCLDAFKNQNGHVGLVLLDIKMPKTSGLDVLSVIKQKSPKLPVVMVTGYHAVQAAKESSARGASAYLTKPFNKEDVTAVVKKWILK